MIDQIKANCISRNTFKWRVSIHPELNGLAPGNTIHQPKADLFAIDQQAKGKSPDPAIRWMERRWMNSTSKRGWRCSVNLWLDIVEFNCLWSRIAVSGAAKSSIGTESWYVGRPCIVLSFVRPVWPSNSIILQDTIPQTNHFLQLSTPKCHLTDSSNRQCRRIRTYRRKQWLSDRCLLLANELKN